MRKSLWLGLFLVFLALGQGSSSYPEGYRFWTHIKSMEIGPGHPLYEAFGGLHHIYANPQALAGYLSDRRSFPDGSVIAFDLLEVRKEQGATLEGPRKLVGVMVKNSSRYARTGGWGFLAFGPNKAPLSIDAQACFTCHQGAASSDYVFSTYRP
ncbi:cytochrome P460 family protein [Meiothermus rufus]|uniref:cytochrome P460 family protein n=1 Tax=Meiothermus rufus TaxID=604332 RepID=UPI0003FD0A61|nr:cytochrome P460 family protein [Meiothermus rufus]